MQNIAKTSIKKLLESMSQKQMGESFEKQCQDEISNDNHQGSVRQPFVKSSEHAQEYQQYFINIQQLDVQAFIHSKATQLSDNQIKYHPNVFHAELGVVFLHNTKHWRALKLLVYLSYFTFEITVLNLCQSSIFTTLKQLGNGSMGHIFTLQIPNQEATAIKSIRYTKNNQKRDQSGQQKNLASAIKEYCLNKLCSVLQIGPKTYNYFGFDLLIFQDTLQFSLEICEVLENVSKEQMAHYLQILHYLHIIHGDIKPDNMMWSRTYKKPVLIDFGLSKVLNEKVGFLTFTSFFGTFQYASYEMKNLYNILSFQLIDLYYNDVHCFKRSMTRKFLRRNYIQQQEQKQRNQNYSHLFLVIEFVKNIQLQKLMFQKDLVKFGKFLQQNRKINLLESTLLLLQQLKDTKFYKHAKKVLEQKKYLQEPLQCKPLLLCPNRKEVTNFEKRIKQNIKENLAAMNGLMIYFLVIYSEDISPNAKYRKQQLQQTIQRADKFDEQFWQNIVQYTMNLYCSQKNILNLFQMLKIKLEIQDWEQLNHPSSQVYSRALSILFFAKQKYGVNLNEKYDGIIEKQKKKSKQFIINHLASYIDCFKQWIDEFKPRIPFIQSNNFELMQKFAQFEEYPIFRQILMHIVKVCNRSADKKMRILKQLELTKLENVWDNFQPAKKAKFYHFNLTFRSRYQIESKLQLCVNRCFHSPILVWHIYYNHFYQYLMQGQINTCRTIKGMKVLQELTKIGLTFECFRVLYEFATQTFDLYIDQQQNKELIQFFRHFEMFYRENIVKLEQIRKMNRRNLIVLRYILLHFYDGISQYLEYNYVRPLLQQIVNWDTQLGQFGTHTNIQQQTLHQSNLILQTYLLRIKIMQRIDKFEWKTRYKYLKEIQNENAQLCCEQVALKFNMQLILASINNNVEAQKNVSIIENFSCIDTVQEVLLRIFKSPFTCAIMSMYYATKTEYFHRGFRFLQNAILKRQLFHSHNIQIQFYLYLFCRNCVWPYISNHNFDNICDMYLKQIKYFRSLSPNTFHKTHSNIIIVLQMLLSTIYTYKMFQKCKKFIKQMLILVCLCAKQASLLAQRMLNRKYPFIIQQLIERKIVVRSQNQQRWQRQMKFRNDQYAMGKKQIWRLLNKVDRQRNRRQNSANRYKYRRIELEIEQKLDKWNKNKGMKISTTRNELIGMNTNMNADIEASVNTSTNMTSMNRDKFGIIYMELANQDSVEDSVLVKQLNFVRFAY